MFTRASYLWAPVIGQQFKNVWWLAIRACQGATCSCWTGQVTDLSRGHRFVRPVARLQIERSDADQLLAVVRQILPNSKRASVQQPSMDVRSIEAKSHRLELRCEARNPPALAGVAGFRVAERVGFEPTVPLRGHLLSREAQSAVLCHLSRVLDSVAARLVLRVGFGARFRTARRLLALAVSGFSSTPVQP